jgi:hypothetical protein
MCKSDSVCQPGNHPSGLIPFLFWPKLVPFLVSGPSQSLFGF